MIERENEEVWTKVQLERLNTQLKYIFSNSPFYKHQKEKLGLSADVHRLSDLQAYPTTSKKDVLEDWRKFLCVPEADLVDLVTTSGTTDAPLIIGLTQKDLERLAENEARALAIGGVTRSDVVQITTTLDKRFVAGLAYYLGLNRIGATAIRSGVGNIDFQWDSVERFQPNTLIAVPSFLHKIGKELGEAKLKKTSVKKAICIGEPLRNADFSKSLLAEKILENWDIDLRSTYASSEMATAFTECEAKRGGHLLPDLVVVEILDENGKWCPPGELGEVTVTPLGVEGMPFLRYRTGDLARLHLESCSCGRTTPRIGPVEGRKNQMIKLKGTTIFPQQIEKVLLELEIQGYQIVLSKEETGGDFVEVICSKEAVEKTIEIEQRLQTVLRVVPKLTFVETSILQKSIFPNGARKPVRIKDTREA